MAVDHLIKNIRWLGHSGFYIKEKPVVYINPFDLAFPDIGDLILITQDHKNKCSPDDIKWLRKGSTVIILPEECKDKFEGDIRVVKAGNVLNVKGATIEVMPVSKKHDPQSKSENNSVGYSIAFSNGLRVYYTGTTELTAEMKPGMTDVLLIPVGKADVRENDTIAEIVNIIQPQIVIPMDWEKDQKDEIENLKKLCQSKLVLLKPKR